MTRFPVTLAREGQVVTVDIDTLSAAELDAWIATQPPEAGWDWVRALVGWIQASVREIPPQKPPWR